MLDRDPDGVGDDGRRQRPGQRVQHLDAPAVGEAVDQVGGDGANAVLPLGHRLGREPAAHDAPMPCVQRRVDVLQLVLHTRDVGVEQLAHATRRDRVRGARLAGEAAQLGRHGSTVGAVGAVGSEDGREVVRSAGDVDHVVVAGHHHDVVDGLAVHRAGGAQLRPDRVRIVDDVLVDGEHALHFDAHGSRG